MANETKNVLSLESKDAMDFFLKSEQYHGFELPEYFVFDELLQNIKEVVEDKALRGMPTGWNITRESI